MTHMAELVILKFNPGEVAELSATLIQSSARNAGGIEENGATSVLMKGAAFTLASFQTMVHVAKHHQLR